MLNDSGIEIDQRFIKSFIEESTEVLSNLKELLEKFKDPSQNQCFTNFAQQIVTIMDTAYSLSLTEIGDLAKFGKELSYKGSLVKDTGKLLSLQSLLSQLVRCLDDILRDLKKNKRHNSDDLKDLIKRLSLASDQLSV